MSVAMTGRWRVIGAEPGTPMHLGVFVNSILGTGRWHNEAMRFRLGMMVGGAIGYVLGARAGRERYEQIQRGYHKFRESQAYDQLSSQATSVGDLARNALAGGLEASSRKMEEVAESDDTIDIPR